MVAAIVILGILIIISLIFNFILGNGLLKLFFNNPQFIEEYFQETCDECYKGVLVVDIATTDGITTIVWDFSQYQEKGLIGLTMRVGKDYKKQQSQISKESTYCVTPAIVYRKGGDFFWEPLGGQL